MSQDNNDIVSLPGRPRNVGVLAQPPVGNSTNNPAATLSFDDQGQLRLSFADSNADIDNITICLHLPGLVADARAQLAKKLEPWFWKGVEPSFVPDEGEAAPVLEFPSSRATQRRTAGGEHRRSGTVVSSRRRHFCQPSR